MDFYVGQTFKKGYPPDAAVWCTKNNAVIKRVESGYIIAAVPRLSDEELFTQLRIARDSRIVATDYMVLSDYPIDDAKLAVVKEYRQALRDLPQQEGAPWDGGGEETPWPVLEFPLVEETETVGGDSVEVAEVSEQGGD